MRRGRRAPRARGRVGPHVIGVANTYDELSAGIGRARRGRAAAHGRGARRDPATFRTDVLNALAAIVEEHRDEGRRRAPPTVRRRPRGRLSPPIAECIMPAPMTSSRLASPAPARGGERDARSRPGAHRVLDGNTTSPSPEPGLASAGPSAHAAADPEPHPNPVADAALHERA